MSIVGRDIYCYCDKRSNQETGINEIIIDSNKIELYSIVSKQVI